jgi:serine/threonine protein kinase
VFTGRLPFDEEAPMATVMMHIKEPVPRPRRFNASIPEPVEQVILKSLAKKPSYRYSTVGALNQALQAALKGESSSMETQVISSAPVRKVLLSTTTINKGPKNAARKLWILPVVLALTAGGFWFLVRLQTAGNTRSAPDENLPLFSTQVPELSDSMQTGANVPPVAPTEVPTPVKSDTCPGLSLFNFQRTDSSVSWSLDNGMQQPVQLINVALLVPQDNWLVSMTLDRDVLIEMDPFTPPDSETGIQIPQDERTAIPAGNTVALELRYAFSDTQPGYGLELLFDGGCTLESGW